jgi:hypothetical protein
MVTSDDTRNEPQLQPIIPVTGELTREPLCEICSDPHPQPVTVLDRGTLQLCADCRQIFGFTGGEND